MRTVTFAAISLFAISGAAAAANLSRPPPMYKAPLEARSDMQVLLSLNGLSLLFFGIFPQQLMGMCVVALTRSY